MPPSRSKARRRAQHPASDMPANAGRSHLFLDDAAFFALVGYITTLAKDKDANPHSQASVSEKSGAETDDDRPAKRQRTDDAGLEFVPIARRTLVLSRKAHFGDDTADGLLSSSLPCLPGNAFFGLRYRANEGLTITAKGRLVPQAARKVVFAPSELKTINRNGLDIIIEIAEKFGSSGPRPGRFWTAFSFNVSNGSRSGASTTLTIELELRWITSMFVSGNLHSEPERTLRNRVLAAFFPDISADNRQREADMENDSWSPQDFYEAAHVTDEDGSEADGLYVPGLTANLFPFQRRAVEWLLQREGVRWAPHEAAAAQSGDEYGPSVVVPYNAPSDPETTSHFIATEDADGETCYVSDLFGVVTRNPSVFEAYEKGLRGGILSEEMGLGKTVEMISLILLNPRPPSPLNEAVHLENGLRPTGATLIVGPPALKNQWISEFKRHAPHLSVMAYAGMARSCTTEAEEADMIEQLASHDVVVTTYSDLKSELHFALQPPDRNMRSNRDDEKRYRPRSPLVQLSWWRVCLDEAQEVESGVSNTATVVRVIPRVNAWGVTGTPVKDGVQDLWGLLLFLLYEPYASVPKVWQNLTRCYKPVFHNLFGRIALRHSKRTVGNELSIPPQKRYVISMPFSAVEEQHYRGLFKQLAEACGLDTLGVPLGNDWNPDDTAILEAMRTALSRLRQTALHPEIGGHNRRVLGNRSGPMRTVSEVLDSMIEQSESALLVDRRSLLALRLKRGQLLENSPRAREALAIWKDVLSDCEALVQEARDNLQAEIERVKTSHDDAAGPGSRGNNKASKEEDEGGDDDDDDDNDDVLFDDEGHERGDSSRISEVQRELRYALELLHKAEFFCANGHFQIKSNEEWTAPNSDEFRRLEALEVDGYERAKRVRQEILQGSRSKAMRLMADLKGKADAQAFVDILDCQFAAPEGIEGRRLGEELDELGLALSTQAAQMDSWRDAVIQLLLKDLVDEEDDEAAERQSGEHASEKENEKEKESGGTDGSDEGQDRREGKAPAEITGDEYEDSTKVQDEIQAYITILKAGISDRNTLLTGLTPSGLALYEERLALQMAKDGDGPAPELMLRLFEERKASMPHSDSGVRALRTVMSDLRELAGRLRTSGGHGGSLHNITGQRAQAELACVMRQLNQAQAEFNRHLKTNAALEKESNKMRNALNTRIAFYKQLQVVSDMVALYEGPKDDQAIEALVREEDELTHTLATAESKHRYLVHLKETDSNEESRMCIICQSTFSIGVLTVCGHQFCKECSTLWFKSRHNCPMCMRKITAANLHDIVLKPQQLKVVDEHGGSGDSGVYGDSAEAGEQQEQQHEAAAAHTKQTGIYKTFSADKLAEIKNIELPGPSFTTKVDTMVRHLLWLQATDPGAKSIVFSQYTQFLAILADAFRHYHIGFSKYTDRNGIERFQDDPAVECFLLHARAHSSGLNLVNASHVLLCEPLLNTALELQAIARVHRIGQKRETTVWLYIVDGTVETSIYDLSVKRRMAHMGRHAKGKQVLSKESTPELLDSSLELANALEMQQAQLTKLMGKGKTAGEEVAKDDLWTCLFGNTAAEDGAAQQLAADEARLRNDPAVRRYLAATAAEARQSAGPGEAA